MDLNGSQWFLMVLNGSYVFFSAYLPYLLTTTTPHNFLQYLKMSAMYSFVTKSSQHALEKYPGIPSTQEFDEFIEKMRIMITKNEDVFRRDIDTNSLSNVYVYLRDSEKFMHEYLHIDFPESDLLTMLERYSVERFEYMLRSTLTSDLLVYLDRLYDDKTNLEKMRIYKNRVLSMKFLREFYRGKEDFNIMDHVIDDLEELINDLMDGDEEDIEFMFSTGDNVVEKGKLPRSTNLDGYNWRTIFQESRVRNRKNNGIEMEEGDQLKKVQERVREKNKKLDQFLKDVTRVENKV